MKQTDDELLKAESFFEAVDRWMRNAQRVCLWLASVAFVFLMYVFLSGGIK